MRRTHILTLVFLAACLCAPARASGEADCGGTPFRFTLYDAQGRLFDGAESVIKAPVALVYYQGYSSAGVLDNLRAAIKHDPVVGDGTRLGELWGGFPIIDYKEG